MKIASRWLPILIAWAVVDAGCAPTKARLDAPSVAASPVSAPGSSASGPPAAAPTGSAVAAPGTGQVREPHRQPSSAARRVGEKLAFAWCLAGGTSFEPFGKDNALASCSEIDVRVSETRSEGGVTTSLIELTLDTRGWEEQRHVVLEADGRIAAFELAHAFSSGIGGFSHSIEVADVQLRDVYGDGSPEWSAEIITEEHDSDMGLCAVHGSVQRDLVLCTSDAGGFACLDVPVSRLGYQEQADMNDGECGAVRARSSGFSRTVSVERGAIRLDPDPKATTFTSPAAPPFQGRLSIQQLLAAAPASRSARL